jgi:hypothetical protein
MGTPAKYTENKPLGRLCKMCKAFFYEFWIVPSVAQNIDLRFRLLLTVTTFSTSFNFIGNFISGEKVCFC